jgi:dihydroorotase
MKALIFILFAVFSYAQDAQYDLLLKGGHVIDPKNGLDAVRDVAIRNGKIAAVGTNLSASAARKTIDLSGLYVTPA